MVVICIIEAVLGSPAVTNIVAGVGVGAAIWGGRKVIKFYQERRLVAHGSFFPQMQTCLLRLRSALRSKRIASKSNDYPFSIALFALAEDRNISEIKETDPYFESEIERVKCYALSFLDFLHGASNRFLPPNSTSRDSWDKYYSQLVEILTTLEGMAAINGFTIENLDLTDEERKNTKIAKEKLIEKVTTYFTDINTVINEMLKFIKDDAGSLETEKHHKS